MQRSNEYMIRAFSEEHGGMHFDAPNKYFDDRISDLNSYLDLYFFKAHVLTKLPLFAKKSPYILDVGAGNGRMTRRFAKIAKHCIAIEPSPVFYQTLYKTTYSIGNVETYQCTLQEYEEITENKCRFDVVFLGGVLPYLNNNEIYECLLSVHRLLEPWGFVFVRHLGTSCHASSFDECSIGDEITRSTSDMAHISARTGFELSYSRRAYPINIFWILFKKWPNPVSTYLWHFASAHRFYPIWRLLAELNRYKLYKTGTSFLFYILSKQDQPK